MTRDNDESIHQKNKIPNLYTSNNTVLGDTQKGEIQCHGGKRQESKYLQNSRKRKQGIGNKEIKENCPTLAETCAFRTKRLTKQRSHITQTF